jgi:hypothetical protein
MAFTLYKLSLKLLSSVADPEFPQRGPGLYIYIPPYILQIDKVFWFLKGDEPLSPTPGSSPEVLLNYFI